MTEQTTFKRRNHFLLLGVIPSIIFLVFVVISLNWQQNVHQTNAMQSHLNHSYHMFYGELYEEARIINALTEQLVQNSEMKDFFLKADRARLIENAKPFFQKVKSDHDISHFYFHSLDKKVFLRVHYPDLFGDQIDRFTLNEAIRNDAVSYGLELGTMGTLTLRVVVPWQVDGKTIGFLELGKEIDAVIHEMKKILEVDLVLVVNKMHLDKEKLNNEYGDKKPGASDWDRFPDVMVFGMTMDSMPPILNSDLAMEHSAHKELMLDINVEGRHFLAGFAPLFDASDKDIGDIVIIKDFTELKSVGNRLTLIMMGGFVFCILIYMVFVFAYLNQLKRRFS